MSEGYVGVSLMITFLDFLLSIAFLFLLVLGIFLFAHAVVCVLDKLGLV